MFLKNKKRTISKNKNWDDDESIVYENKNQFLKDLCNLRLEKSNFQVLIIYK